MGKKKALVEIYQSEMPREAITNDLNKRKQFERNKSFPPKKRTKDTWFSQPSESEVMQGSTSSTTDAVATDVTSMFSQVSEASMMAIGQDQSATSNRSKQQSAKFEQSPHEIPLKKLEGLKQEAQNIAEICCKSRVNGKSKLFAYFYKKYISISKTDKDPIECLQASLALSKFYINNLKEAQPKFIQGEEQDLFRKDMQKCEKFVEQVSDLAILTREQKSRALVEYQKMFQECEKEISGLKESISQQKDADVRKLAKNVNYFNRDMIALGKMIESDYHQHDADLPHLQAIKEKTEKYMQALKDYNSCGQEAKSLDKKDALKLAWQRLGKMVEYVEKLPIAYIKLTESALEALSRTKA